MGIMERYIIKGGKPLDGEVEIGGAKNAALGLLAAAIMTGEEVTLENLPDVSDINQLIDAIENIGAIVNRVDRHTVTINGKTIKSYVVEYEQMKKIRASYYLLGALLGRFKQAEVALPGGCAIGSRPIDQHLKGFRALNADVKEEHGMVIARAEHLIGNHIFLDMASVGATINLMLAASLADGKTTIENAAKEPHVVDVANLLNSMGANIRGACRQGRIQGVEKVTALLILLFGQIEAGIYVNSEDAVFSKVFIIPLGYIFPS